MAGIYSDCSTREIKITARRYASAVYAVVVCPTVRLSQVGVVSKPLDESSWVLAYFHLFHTAFRGKLVSFKNKGIVELWT